MNLAGNCELDVVTRKCCYDIAHQVAFVFQLQKSETVNGILHVTNAEVSDNTVLFRGRASILHLTTAGLVNLV